MENGINFAMNCRRRFSGGHDQLLLVNFPENRAPHCIQTIMFTIEITPYQRLIPPHMEKTMNICIYIHLSIYLSIYLAIYHIVVHIHHYDCFLPIISLVCFRTPYKNPYNPSRFPRCWINQWEIISIILSNFPISLLNMLVFINGDGQKCGILGTLNSLLVDDG